MKKINLKTVAGKFHAYLNAKAANNKEWENNHRYALDQLFTDLPSGSGIDGGTSFAWEASTPDKLIFITSFHHMDEHGGYDGWTEHKVVVTPSLYFGYRMHITGKNRNDIKEYLHSVFAETFEIA